MGWNPLIISLFGMFEFWGFWNQGVVLTWVWCCYCCSLLRLGWTLPPWIANSVVIFFSPFLSPIRCACLICRWMDGCREVFSPEIGSNTCASEFRSRVAEISCSPYSEIDQRPVGPRIHFTMEEFSSAIQYIATSFHSTHPWVFILRLVFFLITVLGT